MLEDPVGIRNEIVLDLCGHHGATTPHTLRINMGIVLGDARSCHSTNEPTSGTAYHSASDCADSGSGQPASCHDRTDAGDRHQAQSREQATCSPNNGAHASPGSCILTGLGPVALVPTSRVPGHDADFIARHSGGYEFTYGVVCIVVIVEQSGYGFHLISPRFHLAPATTLPW